MKYLNENLIRDSYLRLRQKKVGGKKGLERTSALMCFLALDALLKRTGINPPLNLDPEDSSGKTNRDVLTREFARLVHQFWGVIRREKELNDTLLRELSEEPWGQSYCRLIHAAIKVRKEYASNALER